jgi:PTS system cellobiose-specific IIB component
MLRIAICCGGGFSSSALASHLEKETKEKHLDNEASFLFIPIDHLLDRMQEADIAMVCPHMEWKVRADAKKYTIPVSIIAPRLYGLMPALDFIQDAEDLYEIWKKGTDTNYVKFPDEPRPLAVRRSTSHRRWLNGEEADFKAIGNLS